MIGQTFLNTKKLWKIHENAKSLGWSIMFGSGRNYSDMIGIYFGDRNAVYWIIMFEEAMEGFSDAYFLSSRLIQGSRRTFKEHFVRNLVIILNSFYLNQTSSKFISVPACEININCQFYGLFKGSILRVTVIYNHFIDVRVCNDCYNFPLKLWMWFFLGWLIPHSVIPISDYDMRVS